VDWPLVWQFPSPSSGFYVNTVCSEFIDVVSDGLVAPPPPRTMTKEWQQATNERFRELGIEPISGPGNPDYKVLNDYLEIANIQGPGVIYNDFVNKADRQKENKRDEEE